MRRRLKVEGRGWMSKGKLQLGQKYKRKDLEIKMLMENGKLKVLYFLYFLWEENFQVTDAKEVEARRSSG